MNRVLTIAFAASLLSISVVADPSPGAAAPRTRTEGLLKCSLGIGPAACGKNDGCNWGDGPLERVDYLGTNAAGADIYDVKYMHRNTAYVVSPGLNGKTGHSWFKEADPYWINKEISSHSDPALIYARPENSPAAGCTNDLAPESPPN